MNKHEKINYVEFPAKDIEATKAFFAEVFGWAFEDYGPDYTAFSNAGLDGGFTKSDLSASPKHGSVLIVFKALRGLRVVGGRGTGNHDGYVKLKELFYSNNDI